MKRSLLLLFTLLLLGCTAVADDPTPEYKGARFDPPLEVTDFTLTTGDGKQINLNDFSNKIVLLYFGYTFCPDVCPATLADLASVQKQVDNSGDKLQVLMVSVDPERDTPDITHAYAHNFHPTFIGLSGTPEEITAVTQSYGIYVERHEGSAQSGYMVDHTARTMLIQDGAIQLSYPFETPIEDIIHDLNLLIGR